MTWPSWLTDLVGKLFPARMQGEIDEELAHHLELLVTRYMKDGHDHRTARRMALQRFGSFERTRADCASVYGLRQHETTERGARMLNLWQDVRYAFRNLVRQPAFTVIAVVTLAVGIAASTVIFSAVNSTLLNPVPFKDGKRIARVWQASPTGGMRFSPDPLSVNTWRERATSISDIATWGSESMLLRLGNEPERVMVVSTSPELLPLLGLQPTLGRSFFATDTVPGQDHVVMLTERYWKRQYNGERDVVGQTISLNDEPYTIIGVAPQLTESFVPYNSGAPLDYSLLIPGKNMNSTVVKTRPEFTTVQAEQELRQLHAQLGGQTRTPEGWSVELGSTGATVSDNLRTGLWVLFGAVGFVLLVACINVTNMLLVRGVARSHELALRQSLGASTGRMIRQLLAESMMITTSAAGLALWFTYMAVRFLRSHVPSGFAALSQIRFDVPVLATAVLVTAVITLTFGLVPLGQIRKLNLSAMFDTSRSGGWSPTRSGLRNLLVAAEVALATVLFVGAGLMTRTLIQLSRHHPGFQPARVMSFQISIPESRYPTADAQLAFVRDLRDHVAATPVVEDQAIGFLGSFGATEMAVQIEGASEPAPSRLATLSFISDGFFQTVGMPVSGRGFTRREIDNSPDDVVVVSQTFERVYFAGASAVGKRFRTGSDGNWVTIVGVVPDVKLSGMYESQESIHIYVPHTAWAITTKGFVVRTTGEPSTAISLLKAAVWAVDKDIPVHDIESASEMVAEANARPRFSAIIMTAFAFAGLLLASVGVYTVVSMAQQYRKHEIGVRIALGATGEDTLKLMLGYGMKPVLIGAAVGLFSAAGLSRFLQSLLYEVTPLDPVTYAVVVAALMATAMLASFLPARNALRVDPVQVLRCQ